MARATFRFYASLNDFLPPALRGQAVPYEFEQPPSVKHVVEALGVPHPEVDLLLINGAPAPWTQLLAAGDAVSVYPAFHSIDVGAVNLVHPPPQIEPRFVLDCHLGRLAKYLRILGFDTLYRNHCADEELAAISHDEDRALLTMDRDLLKRTLVERGYFVRSGDPRRQLAEVLERFDLFDRIRPLVRCLRCNTPLERVEKEEIIDQIPPRTRAWCNEFQRCPACRQIYWKGSHYDRMAHFVATILDASAHRPKS